jgi:hypothetical protein
LELQAHKIELSTHPPHTQGGDLALLDLLVVLYHNLQVLHKCVIYNFLSRADPSSAPEAPGSGYLKLSTYTVGVEGIEPPT